MIYMHIRTYLREYYDQDGDSKRYGNACLKNLMNLNLECNSYGGMDKYISQFEELSDEFKESKQHLKPDYSILFIFIAFYYNFFLFFQDKMTKYLKVSFYWL